MSSLQIYNTLHRKKEIFESLEKGKVKMYVCGPTVYNFLHVGNFRGPVFFNLVRNWFEANGYEVKFALNFTDVDDKIIDRAEKEGVTALEISEKYIAEYIKDYQSLGLRPHDFNPKVTESMEAIKKMVGDLVANGKAYAVDGEVLYSIKSFASYGKLSNRVTEEMLAGARVEVDQKKKDPLDFTLWKPAKPGEPAWESPWGAGRPGWHIECSAMINELFGEQIDIHGGGSDLIFPHHENEIAQSEGVTGKTFAKYWMHNNMLNFSGAKMSKSLGNIVRLRDFVQEYHCEIYKYMILSVHYRSVSDFGEAAIEKAIRELARIYSALAVTESFLSRAQGAAAPDEKIVAGLWGKISDSLNDDFSTPEVMATFFELIRNFNSQVKLGMKENPVLMKMCANLRELFQRFGKFSGLFAESPAEFLKFLDDMLLKKMNLERSQIQALVDERWQAKQGKDFAKADELRKRLTDMGISVMDTNQGSMWEVSK
jgi:cysteinyl-tRNA synthetase